MICSKCGKELPDNASFCYFCGTGIKPELDIDKMRESALGGCNTLDSEEKTSKQSIKDIFIKNGKLNNIGWGCVIGAILIIVIIASIIAGINLRNKKDIEVAIEETKPSMDIEIKNESEDVYVETDNKEDFSNEIIAEPESDPQDLPGLDDLDDNMELFDGTMITGKLPDSVYETIKGHYDDGFYDTVDIVSQEEMIRFILGGNQSHTYEEKICGYKELKNGYFIFVERGTSKYTYFYIKKNGIEKLFINFSDEWNPSKENFVEGIQVYEKDYTNTEWQDDILPQDILEIIKGTYFSSNNFIMYKIISRSIIEIDDGQGPQFFRIEKYEDFISEYSSFVDIYLDSGRKIRVWFDYEIFMALEYEEADVAISLDRISESPFISYQEASGIYQTSCSPKYYLSDFKITKEADGYYYIVPKNNSAKLCCVDDFTETPSYNKIKISKDAQIGVAETYQYDSIYHWNLNHKFYYFYDIIDTLYANQQIIQTDDYYVFTVQDSSFPTVQDFLPLYPIITFNRDSEVDLFIETYNPDLSFMGGGAY